MEYDFRKIEDGAQKSWREQQTYKVSDKSGKPKYYVLDMFPYPSGQGLHVGHPLGYIASDIFSRYKRLKGFNVLHPMGFDAFGLPAEQYAIQTGQHPAITTEQNIKRYEEQLKKLGLSFDWDRKVQTCDPKYYKWTQWIFLQLFNSWYNKKSEKAEQIDALIAEFESNGNQGIQAATDQIEKFTSEEWLAMNEKEQQETLLNHRLAFLSKAMVNWCPALGTVLANDEVKEGVSERGGHPVVRKEMLQWSLRITAYAQRLLDGLDTIEWSDAMKEMQRNWIGRSEGASVHFVVDGSNDNIEVFTTRPDTIFGATFMVLAPEHELVEQITASGQKAEVSDYVAKAAKRSERDRISDTKTVSGVFTGAYAMNPFTEEKIPIWIADYVLSGYGTGAIMAVPSGDQRDWDFARHFDLSIIPVIEGQDVEKGASENKDGVMINSGFLNGMKIPGAIKTIIGKIEEMKIGEGAINYKMRDAVFGRQRYWGEPIPIYYKDGIPYAMDESELPLLLPEVDKYLPTEDGEPPLKRAENWNTEDGNPIEPTTMPGWAGSSWYYLRYMDPNNDREFVAKDKLDYWQNVDVYVGGAEHATGHLLYVRFWTKFLYDLGYLPFDEPAKKLINQGMITGETKVFLYCSEQKIALSNDIETFWVHKQSGVTDFSDWPQYNNRIDEYERVIAELTQQGISLRDFNSQQRVPLELHKDDILDISTFKKWSFVNGRFDDYEFLQTSNQFELGTLIEKMSKSKHNATNPDKICEQYGADTLRLYEMFLGPLEQHKPWNTKGIEGVHRFLRKLWRLYHLTPNPSPKNRRGAFLPLSLGGDPDLSGEGVDEKFYVSNEEPTDEELKTLHKTIKKVQADTESFDFNTAVSAMMICVNELTDLKCNKRTILEQLALIVSPYAPHIAQELWILLGNKGSSICDAEFPVYNEQCLVEDCFSYPVSFNGKFRFQLELPVTLSPQEVEKEVLACEKAQKYLEGKKPKKVIVVPKRIVNVVI